MRSPHTGRSRGRRERRSEKKVRWCESHLLVESSRLVRSSSVYHLCSPRHSNNFQTSRKAKCSQSHVIPCSPSCKENNSIVEEMLL
jgi:hypothetical protein